MARRRRQLAQVEMFGTMVDRQLREGVPVGDFKIHENYVGPVKSQIMIEADDRPRCVLCGRPVPPDGVWSARLDGSACPKCHEGWLEKNDG